LGSCIECACGLQAAVDKELEARRIERQRREAQDALRAEQRRREQEAAEQRRRQEAEAAAAAAHRAQNGELYFNSAAMLCSLPSFLPCRVLSVLQALLLQRALWHQASSIPHAVSVNDMPTSSIHAGSRHGSPVNGTAGITSYVQTLATKAASEAVSLAAGAAAVLQEVLLPPDNGGAGPRR
jgi:hypothetical protein